MILQALYNHYFTLKEQGGNNLPPLGMEYKNIPFIIVIDQMGNFIRLEDTRNDLQSNGEQFLVPLEKERSGNDSYKEANLLWDKSKYILPSSIGKDDKCDASSKSHNKSFVQEINRISKSYPYNNEFKALKALYQNEESLCKLAKEMPKKDVLFSFKLIGCKQIIASHPDVVSYITNNLKKNAGQLSDLLNIEVSKLSTKPTNEHETSDAFVDGRCLVTCKQSSLMRKHSSIKGISGDKPKLISSQLDSSYDSYGKSQGYNAPISVVASHAITAALVELLSPDRSTNFSLGDMKLVFWNANYNKDLINAYKVATFSTQFGESKQNEVDRRKDDNEDIEDASYKVYEALNAVAGKKDSYIDIETTDRFYILGLSPNKKRLAVKLWYEGTVREIVSNTIQHLNDMNIVSYKGIVEDRHPPFRNLYHIVNEVSIGEQDKWSSNLIQAIIRSIVCGLPYPRTLQLACLERTFQERKVTNLRAAILKAHLIRTNKSHQITMALDITNTNKAYLSGRLFAILERIFIIANEPNKNSDKKEKASESKFNTNNQFAYRDRYFRAAGSTPAAIFGRLIELSTYHLSKIKKEKEKAYLADILDRDLAKVFALISGENPGFPKLFNLDEKSLFVVGYYHQSAFRNKGNDEIESETE